MSDRSGKQPDGPPSSPLSATSIDPAGETFVSKGPLRATTRFGILTITAGDDAGRVITLPNQPVVTLGRSPDCDVRFDDGSLSRLHARIMHFGEDYLLGDANSKNGTFVNDRRLDKPVTLSDGDRIQLGSGSRLRFALVDEAEERALREMYEARRRGTLIAALERAESSRESALTEDLMQAREFQRRTLPAPPEIPGVSVEIIYRPLEMVGGDLYQLTAESSSRLRVFIADATGHGVKASLTTVLIMSEYELLKNTQGGPAQVLSLLNDHIATTFSHLSVQFTAAVFDFDFARGTLQYATAAHPSSCLVRGGKLYELESGGPFMGLVPNITYPWWQVPISQGDHLVTFTDGATEAFDPSGDSFGDDRLYQTIETAARAGSPLGAAVSARLDAFVGEGNALSDDLTILTISWS